MSDFSARRLPLYCFLVTGAVFAAIFLRGLELKLPGSDIVAVWREGQRLADGVNPYQRILSHEDITRDNYFPPYLPGFYLLVALLIQLGLTNFQLFITPWRFVSMALHVLIGAVILRRAIAVRQLALGVALALVWTLNRWSLFLVQDGPIDTVPLALIALALTSPAGSLKRAFLFSLSLAVKHMGIFLLPLFVIDQLRGQRKLAGVCALGAVPLLVAAPFVIWNVHGFIKSLLMQVTRGHQAFPNTVTVMLGMPDGWISRIPMLAACAFVYFLFWRGRIEFAAAGCLVMSIFVALNPTLLTHYMVWPILLGIFSVLERPSPAPSTP